MLEKLPVGYNYSTCYKCGKFIVVPMPIMAGENPIIDEYDYCRECNPDYTCPKCGIKLKESTLTVETKEIREYEAKMLDDATISVHTDTSNHIDDIETAKIFCQCGIELDLSGDIDYV
jgi:hypothetical protein